MAHPFRTAGMVMDSKIIMGGGYQFALTSNAIAAKAPTPIYDHNWVMSAAGILQNCLQPPL